MYGAEERNRAANATGGSMEEAQSANEVWSRVKRRLRRLHQPCAIGIYRAR